MTATGSLSQAAIETTAIAAPGAVGMGLVLILDIVSVVAVLSLVRAAQLHITDPGKRVRHPSEWQVRLTAPAFLVLSAVVLGAANVLSTSGSLRGTALLLIGWMGAAAAYYYGLLRRSWEDDNIRYTMLLWAAAWLLTASLLLVLWYIGDNVEFRIGTIDGQSFSQYINTFSQVAGIIIAATMVIVSNRHSAKEGDETARRKIYQTLELESIRLFQFECDRPTLIKLLWYPPTDPFNTLAAPSGVDPDVLKYQLKQYICQMLNLFEMSVRFCKQRIFEPEVFGSWIIWMWELCKEPMFQVAWRGDRDDGEEDGIEFNYVAELRDIINAGIYYATETPGLVAAVTESQLNAVRQASFYCFVAARMFSNDEVAQRDLVRRWLTREEADVDMFKPHWRDGQALVTSMADGSPA